MQNTLIVLLLLAALNVTAQTKTKPLHVGVVSHTHVHGILEGPKTN
jgi:hypothetical protein